MSTVAAQHTPQSPRNGWTTMLSRTQTIFASNKPRNFSSKQQHLNNSLRRSRPRRASDPLNSNLFLPFDGEPATDPPPDYNAVTLLKSPITITSPRFDPSDESSDDVITPIANNMKPAREFFNRVRQELQRQVSQKLPRRKRSFPGLASSNNPSSESGTTTSDTPPLTNSLIIATAPLSQSAASSIHHTPVTPAYDSSGSTFSRRTFSSSDQSSGGSTHSANNPKHNFGLGIDMRLFRHDLRFTNGSNDSKITFHDSDPEDVGEIIPPSISSPGNKAGNEKVWCPLTPPPTSPMPHHHSVYSNTGGGFSTPSSIMLEDHYDGSHLTSRSSFSSLTREKPLSLHHSKSCLPHTRPLGCNCSPVLTDVSQMRAQMKIDDDAYAAAERRLRKSGWCSNNDIEEIRRKRKLIRQEWKSKIKTIDQQQKCQQDAKH